MRLRAFESKWDGVRAIATTGTKPPALWSRNGNNFSASFPEIVDALSAVLDHRETVLDGGTLVTCVRKGAAVASRRYTFPDVDPGCDCGASSFSFE